MFVSLTYSYQSPRYDRLDLTCHTLPVAVKCNGRIRTASQIVGAIQTSRGGTNIFSPNALNRNRMWECGLNSCTTGGALMNIVMQFQAAQVAENSWLANQLLTDFSKILLSWVLPEKPPVVQLPKNFQIFYGTRMFITVFIRTRHWSLS
jgi:hypothetical protein